jgi:hypothetical protein
LSAVSGRKRNYDYSSLVMVVRFYILAFIDYFFFSFPTPTMSKLCELLFWSQER